MGNNYYSLENLEVYKLSREISKLSWEIYKEFDWQLKKIIGDQFIRSCDSVSANIAEGYGRYHYLDKIRFYYNARGSFLEYLHWVDLLLERDLIEKSKYEEIMGFCNKLQIKLNNFISSTYQAKLNSK